MLQTVTIAIFFSKTGRKCLEHNAQLDEIVEKYAACTCAVKFLNQQVVEIVTQTIA